MAATESGVGAGDFLPRLRKLARNDPVRNLRVVTGELMTACYAAELTPGLIGAEVALSLVERVQDPYARSSFFYSLSHCYGFAGRYREALATSDRALEEAEQHGLAFAIPHAELVRAHAHTGLRQFASAGALLERLVAVARHADPFVQENARFVFVRLAISERRPKDALALAQRFIEPSAAVPLRGEHHALLALAHSIQPNLDPAAVEGACAIAREVSKDAITRSLVFAVDLVMAGRTEDAEAARTAWEGIRQLGVFDSAVCAYRGWPTILRFLVDAPDFLAVVAQANDAATAARQGIKLSGAPPPELLSPREREVHDLLSRGLTNREIAQKLFISEVTVKVHVRHILEKLGVRRRTQAATLTSTGEQRYATADPDADADADA
jgi:DNA-binding NarL/FixJ family response regulator